MIPITAAPPELSSLSLYYTRDSLLEDLPVLIFYGPSTTVNSTHNTSRIQAHIYTLAGFQTFPRLTVAPTSPLYAAVKNLPADRQGDEICRGLAVGLLSYFAGISKATKAALREVAAASRRNHSAPMMFDEMHAADLAAQMVQIEEPTRIANFITSCLPMYGVSWMDVDLVLPHGTIHRATTMEGPDVVPLYDHNGLPLFDYGQYTALVNQLGVSAFLPTSKLRRAPSRSKAPSKSRTISKEQKISLRQEMCELVDTENSYMGKIHDLINTVATDFRLSARPEAASALFPESLDQILRISEAFYDSLQSILDTTENDAIRDIEGKAIIEGSISETATQSPRRDPTGASIFAKALYGWFPRFMAPYQDYLRASANFPQIIGQCLTDDSSSVSNILSEYGEQRLRSGLIEPVQRLPRYSLLIDNMTNVLPVSHPASASLLKARDIVTDICALDSSAMTDTTRTEKLFRSLVLDWPISLSPNGHLVTAVDVAELVPPYAASDGGTASILLLFPDYLVVVHKASESSLSARGIIAEVDRSTNSTSTISSSTSGSEKALRFVDAYDLSHSQFTESENGCLIKMTRSQQDSQQPLQSSSMVFSLLGPYEGKAVRFSEEAAKARIQSRYSEVVRDSWKWALRSISASEEHLGLQAALSEEILIPADNFQQSWGQIHISVDGTMDTKRVLADTIHVKIAACITKIKSGGYQLQTESAEGNCFTDTCTLDTIIPILIKRLGTLVRLQNQPQASSRTYVQISDHRVVLESVPFRSQQDETRHRGFHPISPVKLISNLLGGSSSQADTPSKARNGLSMMKSVPIVAPPTPSHSRSRAHSKLEEEALSSKVTLVDTPPEFSKSPFALLEDTFTAYIIALHSRSGNVVGRVLRNRAAADELTINELYNILLEDPSRLQAAAEVPVDVLFAAFEKFLRRAWRERMGPLVSPSMLQDMQSSFDSGKPAMFAQQFKKSMENMSPQNSRAFAATIKLLSDLLDASGNDGDRGVLIASFAEALALVGDPHNHITLLDRLVDDYDNLFDDTSADLNGETNTRSATGSLTRIRSVNTGSVSSNTSSLRKIFGLGTLSRENSKTESESKVASIWRSLSKNAKSSGDNHLPQIYSQPGSLSKASALVRSRSTDTDPRTLPSLRSISRERPGTSSSAPSDEQQSRPGSAHLNPSTLSSITEGTPTKAAILPRKKRRSSLSDLRTIQRNEAVAAWSPTPLRLNKLDVTPQRKELTKALPQTPSPTKQAFERQVNRQSQRSALPQRFGSPHLNENSPTRNRCIYKEKTPSPKHGKNIISRRSDEVVITSYPVQRRNASRSGIPTPKAGLIERKWPPNGNQNPPKKVSQSPQKLRMQSPQTIRERLSQEQRALASSDLQAEINKIGEELSTFEVKHPSPSPVKQGTQATTSLNTTLEALKSKLDSFISGHTAANASLRSDLESSLLVSDKKVRKLDELYREANAENEALYERFNDELGKILGKVRKGEGVEEMRGKLREAQEEVGRLKKENANLKRGIVGLRSMMKGE